MDNRFQSFLRQLAAVFFVFVQKTIAIFLCKRKASRLSAKIAMEYVRTGLEIIGAAHRYIYKNFLQ
jgi:hypothetical protein